MTELSSVFRNVYHIRKLYVIVRIIFARGRSCERRDFPTSTCVRSTYIAEVPSKSGGRSKQNSLLIMSQPFLLQIVQWIP